MTNEELRRKLLELLNAKAHTAVLDDDLEKLAHPGWVATEIRYLESHGLCKADYTAFNGDVIYAQITAKGRDYMDPTGGLGAELNVVTVKLHEDTLRQIFINRVKASEADETVKSKLVDQLKALPAEGLSKLAEKALEKGLQHMPGALQWLQTAPWS